MKFSIQSNSIVLLKIVRVKLSPEIRSVFDQLLATEDALAIERDNARYKIPDEIMASATASEQEQMAELSERAAIEARNTVMNRTSEAMRREGTDKRRKQEKLKNDKYRNHSS